MLKALKRLLLLFLLMIAVAAVSGYVTYTVTSNLLKNSLPEKTISTAASPRQSSTADTQTAQNDTPLSFDCYIVRLEGSNLGVYASHSDREEFLYNESIYINDLSEDDIKLLKEGVRLTDSSELTGFIENFTS